MNGNQYRPSMMTLLATLITMDAPALAVEGLHHMSGAPVFGRQAVRPLKPIDMDAVKAAAEKRARKRALRAKT